MPTCTTAVSTNGTRRRRLPWRSRRVCTRPASTVRSWSTTRLTRCCRIFLSVKRHLLARCWKPSAWPGVSTGAGLLTGSAARERHRYRLACPRPTQARRPGVCLMSVTRSDYSPSQLEVLEAESIHMMREVAAEFERPVLLFSGGKDSIVMLALAERAFWPARIPFPVMHVDTGHNFPEVLAYRDRRVADLGIRLIVASVLDAISEHRFDAVFGGGRRDEEKARAKERVFSIRDEFGQWDPKNQRPELWNVYNTRIRRGEQIRVFPLSNWTELDVWHFIAREKLEIPSIYFSHRRAVFERDGILLADNPYLAPAQDEPVFEASVRYRTVGDMTCTGAVESTAGTIAEVITEIAATRITERGQTRADDRTSEAAMEDRKREGYF